MAYNNILDRLIRKYKKAEESCDNFIHKLFPDVILKHIVDRRTRLYDGDIADENNCKYYIRYLRRHWLLLRESSTFREEYYQQQLKLKQIEDNGHNIARELRAWLTDDAHNKLTKFTEQYVTYHQNNKQQENIELMKDYCENSINNIDASSSDEEILLVRPQASLKKENKNRKNLIRQKRVQEDSFLNKAIRDNEHILSTDDIFVRGDKNTPITMCSLALYKLAEYVSIEYLSNLGYINPMFTSIIGYSALYYLKQASIHKMGPFKRRKNNELVHPMNCNVSPEVRNWYGGMIYLYINNNTTISSTIYMLTYILRYISDPLKSKEEKLCKNTCLVCAIKYYHYEIEGGNTFIPSCEKICKRSSYKVKTNAMGNKLDEIYRNKSCLLTRIIYINDSNHFIYIPHNIFTNKEITKWLCSITWLKDCVVEHISKEPKDIPVGIDKSHIWKWVNFVADPWEYMLGVFDDTIKKIQKMGTFKTERLLELGKTLDSLKKLKICGKKYLKTLNNGLK